MVILQHFQLLHQLVVVEAEQEDKLQNHNQDFQEVQEEVLEVEEQNQVDQEIPLQRHLLKEVMVEPADQVMLD
jgi:hypothetical protein